MVQVRLASREEVPLLPDIERSACALFDQFEITATLPLHLTPLEDFYDAQENGRLWIVAPPEGQPVGFALVEMLDGVAHLEELDIYPEHGRKGLGTLLVRTVCNWAGENGIVAVTLTTFRDIPWNAPFYQKLGFRILEAGELTPALIERVDEEERHGLPRGLRVVMRFDLHFS